MSTPNESWLVSEIKEFLDVNGVLYKPSENKASLLEKAGAVSGG